ncbi:hypothetical protein ACJMK2_000827 [Sinanodonta woodiana]|uniref:Uncharacterized protein n=1 Tax=Sinanodonta woodiana TaxID=1069815 RepID=A0ABD3XQI0_SINWO
MLNVLPITASTHLTADEAMNTDVINKEWVLKKIIFENFLLSIKEPTLQLRLNHVFQPDLQVALTVSKMAGLTICWCSVRSKMMRCPAIILLVQTKYAYISSII